VVRSSKLYQLHTLALIAADFILLPPTHMYITASRDNTAGGKKISSSSSVPGLRTYNSGVNARHITIEHRSACGREGPLKCSSVYSAPVKRRALVSNTESYHGRLEF
jgi:hypothetical protein